MTCRLIIILMILYAGCITKASFESEIARVDTFIKVNNKSIAAYKWILIINTSGCSPCVVRTAELMHNNFELDSILYIASSNSNKEIRLTFSPEVRRKSNFLIDSTSWFDEISWETPKLLEIHNGEVIRTSEVTYKNVDSLFRSFKKGA